MKKLIVIVGWMISSSLALIVSVTTIHFLRQAQTFDATGMMPNQNSGIQNILNFNSNKKPAVDGEIGTGDARPILIAQFLESNDSVLKPYDYWGEFLTDLADKYGLDYRLLPSIAMQESNLCRKIPENSYNCLGLGIHARGTWEFPSFESNFDKAAEILRQNYINEGYITPDQIQDKYTPGSNGSWEFAVNQFMDKLEYADF